MTKIAKTPQEATRTERNKLRRAARHAKLLAVHRAKAAAKPMVPATPKKKVKVVAEAPRVMSVMRSAFDDIMLRNVKLANPGVRELAGNVLDALKTNIGTRVQGKEWNAHLSFKTAKELVMPGCDKPYARMPYDRMVNG